MMGYYQHKTDRTFQYEMRMYNRAMQSPILQTAYTLLCQAAEAEYATGLGALRFVIDATDTAAMSRRPDWRKDYRAKLYKRTQKRPKTRAALNAYLSIYQRTVNQHFDWRNEQKEQ